MAVYAFQDVRGAIVGPFISQAIGAGSGNAEGGIEIEMADDKNTLTMGIDGTGQHNLHAARNGTITIRVLKTAPLNAILQKAYDQQTGPAASAYHGQNTLSVYNVLSGDNITALECAFKKFPRNQYDKDGPVMEWVWDCVLITTEFGLGGPAFSIAS